MRTVTSALVSAIRQYLDAQGLSSTALSERLGWGRSTIPRWLSGHSSRISPEKYTALLPLIRPYLPDEPGAPQELSRTDVSALPRVPVIGLAQAADYEQALQSLADFALDASDGDTIQAPWAEDGDVALTVEGNSMAPWYPPGTVLLVRPGAYPETGDIVAARLADGPLVVKRYHRRNGIVTLQALNEGPEGQTIEWHTKTEPGRILWMWPVIASWRHERSVRRKAQSMGLYQ